VQKETENLNGLKADENLVPRATAENQISNKSDGSVNTPALDAENQNPADETKEIDSSAVDFEELIKGPYKDAFAKKVQGIINKRFKEQKTAESKLAEQRESGNLPDSTEKATQSGEQAPEKSDSTYNSLIEAGVDPETAYRVLHLDEIMDSSVRYGAELASKHIADSLRQKAARPAESALSGKGYSAKTSVGSLTPEKRRELAKKALMGEQIGF